MQETEEFSTIRKMTEKFPPVARLRKLSTSKLPWTSPILRRRKCSFASLIFPSSSVDFYANSSEVFLEVLNPCVGRLEVIRTSVMIFLHCGDVGLGRSVIILQCWICRCMVFLMQKSCFE